MLKKIAIVLAALVGLLLVLAGSGWLLRFELMRWQLDLPAYTHSVGDVRTEAVAMRDGAGLATRIFIPERAGADAGGAWPTILVRDPYNIPDIAICEILVRFGYACVHQLVRGRFDSEGDWTPLVNERDDGIDTLAWLTEQPFQDENIALYGLSYLAMVQWSVADVLPPEVKTIMPYVFATDVRPVLYENGMFRHEIWTAWAAAMPRREFLLDRNEPYQQAIRHRPHVEVDEKFFGGRLPWYRTWLDAASPTHASWQTPGYALMREMPSRVTVPVFAMGGWHDLFVASQLSDFARLGSRARSKLIIGPWGHTLTPLGDVEHSPGIEGESSWARALDWLGHHLRGEPLDQEVGIIETYTIGEDRWHRRTAWPPQTTRRRFHLGEPEAASGCDGGRLSDQTPDARSQASYRYDPLDPVPTRGGAAMLAYLIPGIDGAPAGAVNQPGLCQRPDVLSFVTTPFDAAWTLAGAAEVALTVASDAPDTAFTAKLIEVRPDGRALNIRDGITSLAYRNAASTPQPYSPGAPVEIRIPLWPIEWQVAAGSRLRLDVSSSNFPAFHAHPNRAGAWAEVREAVAAEQTLYVGPTHPAYLDVPVRLED